jgi:hypothetical protein
LLLLASDQAGAHQPGLAAKRSIPMNNSALAALSMAEMSAVMSPA